MYVRAARYVNPALATMARIVRVVEDYIGLGHLILSSEALHFIDPQPSVASPLNS